MTAGLLPLDGIRVVNFGVGGVAPWASSQLAQLGATVVKIEAPNEFIMYTMPPWRGITTTYAALNANCRSVKLNLKDEADQKLAWSLVEAADVMIENFRSGAIDRMGFGFEAVSRRNPRIVFCSSSGFGREGAMAGLPCTDPHIQAFSGFATLNGSGPEGERVRYYGMIDLYTGQLIAEAALAGLIARRRSGQPQYIEMTMLGGATAMLMTQLAARLRGGAPPAGLGARGRHTAPDGLYATADGTIALTVENDAQWQALCGVLERGDLAADRHFASAEGRRSAAAAVEGELSAALAAAPADWWLAALRRAGVPCARVQRDHEVAAHRETWQRGHLRELAVSDKGTLQAAAPAWDFDGTDAVPGRAPWPGEDTALLREDPAGFWQALEKDRR
ncbi:MAG: CaiB/BaiF CoA transferase family protein [Alphaproteobacteria bacterium]